MKSEKDKYSIAYMWNLKKMLQMNRLTDLDNEFMITGGEDGSGIDWEFGIVMYVLLYLT